MGKNKTIHAYHGSCHDAQSSRSTNKISTEHVDRDGDPALTSAQIKQFSANLQKHTVRATKFYYMESLINLEIDDCLQDMFSNMGWSDYLDLFTRTYKQPTLKFFSTYAPDDATCVLPFDSRVNRTDSHTTPSTPF